MRPGRYFTTGMAFLISGLAIGLFSYFGVRSVTFTAVGAAIVLIGATASCLPEEVTGSKAMKVLLRGSAMGVDTLLREVKARQKDLEMSRSDLSKTKPSSTEHQEISNKKHRAIYLPPGVDNSDVNLTLALSVYLPLSDTVPLSLDEMMHSPTKLTSDISQAGLRVFTPGTYINQIPELSNEGISVEDALNFVLSDCAELCTSVKASEIEEIIVAEINNVKIKQEPDAYRELLGSVPVSLAASVIAAVRKRSVEVEDEEIAPNKTIARFKVHQRQMTKPGW